MKQFWLFYILLCSTPYYLSMSNALSSISPGSRLACIHGFWRNCVRHLSRRAFHEQHFKKSIVLIYKPTCLLARINCFIRSTIHKIPYGFILNGSKTYTITCQSFDVSWQKGIPIEKYVATCCLFEDRRFVTTARQGSRCLYSLPLLCLLGLSKMRVHMSFVSGSVNSVLGFRKATISAGSEISVITKCDWLSGNGDSLPDIMPRPVYDHRRLIKPRRCICCAFKSVLLDSTHAMSFVMISSQLTG